MSITATVAGGLPSRPGRDHIRRAIQTWFETRDSVRPDTVARDEVVAAYQGLAYSLASRYAQRGEEMDDLNQVALIGLLKAIDRFDPHRGAELTTFATATIVGELKRHLRDRSWSVRLPRRVHDLHLRAQQAIDELSQELGRPPTLAEIGERLDAAVADVVEALDASGFRHNASLEAHGRLTLSPLLARLPERQRQILQLRFGTGCSQTEIAELVGVSQMQVSRLLARSLAQLRDWAADPSLDTDVEAS
jgi:RNA polymerase sigma-B factor